MPAGDAAGPVLLSNAGQAVMTFCRMWEYRRALIEFHFEVSAHIIPQDVAHVIPHLRERIAARGTALATPSAPQW